MSVVWGVIVVVVVLGYGEYAGWLSSSWSGEGCEFRPFGAGYECGVSFIEKGLPSGTEWIIHLPGHDVSFTTSAGTFYEPNGTYAWHINPAFTSTALYAATPSTGNVTVTGSAVFVWISFTYSGTIP
jgi:hypothetical protein